MYVEKKVHLHSLIRICIVRLKVGIHLMYTSTPKAKKKKQKNLLQGQRKCFPLRTNLCHKADITMLNELPPSLKSTSVSLKGNEYIFRGGNCQTVCVYLPKKVYFKEKRK